MQSESFSQSHEKNEQKAWVVFSGKSDLWWLSILKPGFRHCYSYG
jgi:hypothetical protein